jgi:hypothetical protein
MGRKNPSVSQSERGRGFEGMCRQITPLPCNLSKGGIGGDALTEETPSISCFEQGRGVEGVDRGNTPSVSHFERARGFEGMCRQITPLSHNLSKRGVGGDASTEETSPPSRVLSEGGGGSSNTMKRPSLCHVGSVGWSVNFKSISAGAPLRLCPGGRQRVWVTKKEPSTCFRATSDCHG